MIEPSPAADGSLSNIDSKAAASDDLTAKMEDEGSPPKEPASESQKCGWPASTIDQVSGSKATAPQCPLDAMEVDDTALNGFKNAFETSVEHMEVDEGERKESAKRQRGSSSSESGLASPPDPLIEMLCPILTKIFGMDFSKEHQEVLTNRKGCPFGDGDDFCANNLVQKAVGELIAATFSEHPSSVPNLYKDLSHRETSPIEPALQEDLAKRTDIQNITALRYLLESYERIDAQVKEVKLIKQFAEQLKDILAEVKKQCINFIVLVLTNTFSSHSSGTCSVSPLLPFVMHQWPRGDFLYELVCSTYAEGGMDGNFRTIFEPLLLSLWQEMVSCCTLTDERYKLPLQALMELCDLRVNYPTPNRPICQLVRI